MQIESRSWVDLAHDDDDDDDDDDNDNYNERPVSW
jgi:hypothetical protein